MDTLLKLADVFLPLPEEKQKEILDFAEFLFKKHAKEVLNDGEQPYSPEPSEALLTLLKERFKQHRQNPQLARKWIELKEELLRKYK